MSKKYKNKYVHHYQKLKKPQITNSIRQESISQQKRQQKDLKNITAIEDSSNIYSSMN